MSNPFPKPNNDEEPATSWFDFIKPWRKLKSPIPVDTKKNEGKRMIVRLIRRLKDREEK